MGQRAAKSSPERGRARQGGWVGSRAAPFQPLEIKNPTLRQGYQKEVARLTGLEPATPGVTGRYSNQLSYNRAMGAE